ncbi:MAG: hypothetical protein J2P19_35210 [Pseudonocardia sp.]|nr:hypothetical protein [Pseudonocardia sp.]
MPSLVATAVRVGRVMPGRRRRPGSPEPGRPHGPTLPLGRDPEGLTRWQAEWAQWRLDAMRPDDYRAVCAALFDASPSDRSYLRRAIAAGHPAAAVLSLVARLASEPPGWAAQRLRLVDDEPGPQRRFGVPIDQVDATTCGSAVLLVLDTWADPLAAMALTTPEFDFLGFGYRFDQRQLAIHRQSNRLWPRVLGTSPWGMAGWLRRHAAGLGPYRVRLVDADSADDIAAAVAEVDAALDLGDPVPLLVGAGVPRHYGLALGRDAGGWRVYDPGVAEVRVVPAETVREGKLAPLLGFDRLQAVLLPLRGP